MSDVHLAHERYQAILSDVMAGKNLETHLQEVEEAIVEIDKLIGVAHLRKEDTSEYEKLKNEIYYLKYEILERM